MKFRSSLAVFAVLIFWPLCAQAQDNDLKTRVELAKKMVELMPAKAQVESAASRYVEMNLREYSEKDRDTVRRAILNLINPKALDKASTDAYAETYTAAELGAMIDYYSKPEAQSAMAKINEFSSRMLPEIIKIMDQAVLQLRVAAKPKDH